MKTKNTLSYWKYVLCHIIIGYIVCEKYYDLLFECIPGYEFYESRKILCILSGIITGICFACTYNRNRNIFNALLNVLFPFCIYTILVYVHYFKLTVSIILGFIVILLLVFSFMIFSRKIKGNKNKIIRMRVRNWIVCCRTISTSLIMILVIGLSIASQGNLIKAKNISTHEVVKTEYTIEDNIETISQLHDSNWRNLTIGDRLEVLQTVADIEIQYLGINTRLTVGATPLDDYVSGQYVYDKHAIIIDIDHLRNHSASDVLRTILHECRHAYQYRTIEMLNEAGNEFHNLYLCREVQEFKKGFANYKTDTVDGYWNNPVEIDARDYAESRCEIYSKVF